MPKPKGGRGHTAPYETKLTRIPIPLAEQISELVERYQEHIASGGEAFSPPPLLDAITSDKVVNELNELGDLRKLVANLEEELNRVHALNGDLNLQIQELQHQLAEAQGEINFQESRWKLTERMNTGLAQEIREVKSQLADKNTTKPVNKLLASKSDKQIKPAPKAAPKAAPKTKRLSSASAAALISVRENALHAASVEPDLNAVASDLVNSIDKAIGKPVNNLEPLNLNKLAKRLGYQSHPHLSRTKLRADFTDLSRERDPDGIGWRYDVESKLFYPVQ